MSNFAVSLLVSALLLVAVAMFVYAIRAPVNHTAKLVMDNGQTVRGRMASEPACLDFTSSIALHVESANCETD